MLWWEWALVISFFALVMGFMYWRKVQKPKPKLRKDAASEEDLYEQRLAQIRSAAATARMEREGGESHEKYLTAQRVARNAAGW